MTAKDLIGFNKADEPDTQKDTHEPGPAKDAFGLNTATEDSHNSDGNSDE